MVLAYHEETGEIGFYPVTAVWAHEDPVVMLLTIEGETLETTPNHPFYTAVGEWVQAGSLQPGDEIRDAAWGTGTVEAITFLATPQVMYNFTVATAHTYFVGDGQWLVHNANCHSFFLDAGNGKGLLAELDGDGIVTFAVEAGRDSSIRGSEMFDQMMNHFGSDVKAIGGNWFYGDNLATVNQLTSQGVSLQQAVAQTWTAAQASRHGFTNVAVMEVAGEPGNYSKIQVIFNR